MVDLHDPSAPAEVTREVADSSGGRLAFGDHGRLYQTEHSRVNVFDRSTLAPLGSTPEAGVLESFAASGSLGVLYTWNRGIATYDLSDPRNPVRLAVLELPGNADEVALVGMSVALVVAQEEGLQVVNVSDPRHPVLIGRLATEGAAFDVAAEGTLAVVATGLYTHEERAVEVVDLTEPRRPECLARVTSPLTTVASLGGVALRDGVVYVANDTGLTLISLAEPSAPVVLSSLELWPYVTDVALAGDLAIVTSWRGTAAVDVSDQRYPSHTYAAAGSYPVTLTLSSEYGTDSVTHQVEVTDRLAPRRPAGRLP